MRLALADTYLERAQLGALDDELSRTVDVGIAVTAGIAFADAICLAAFGVRSAGENHGDAVDLLRDADPEAARALNALLTLKTQAQYGSTAISRDKAARAMRAVELLAARAREI